MPLFRILRRFKTLSPPFGYHPTQTPTFSPHSLYTYKHINTSTSRTNGMTSLHSLPHTPNTKQSIQPAPRPSAFNRQYIQRPHCLATSRNTTQRLTITNGTYLQTKSRGTRYRQTDTPKTHPPKKCGGSPNVAYLCFVFF